MGAGGLAPPAPQTWHGLLEMALAEDLGPGDITSEICIPAQALASARIEARTAMTVSGLFVARAVFEAVDSSLEIEAGCDEGSVVEAGAVLLRIKGSLRSILAAERTALNFLGRLCGISTLTRRCVDAVAGTGCQIVDTRKTQPGWRALDKFAVAAGGGVNHRFALYDGILLKDNHVAALGGVAEAASEAIARAPAGLRVQVEVESLAQAEAARGAGVDFLLLDNRSPDEVREIVERMGDTVLLEASGGITLDNLRSYAETGVQRISLGALTHSVISADVALELDEPPRPASER